MVDGLEGDDLSSFQKGVGVSHVEEITIDLLMEHEVQVFRLDACGEFDFEESTPVVQSDHKEGGGCGDRRKLRIELVKVLLSPWVDTF